DGSDYQYDVTFGWNAGVHSPKSTRWLDGTLAPALRSALHAMGHIPGPLIPEDPVNGLTMATVPPRFSTGYGDLRHIPTVLVESRTSPSAISGSTRTEYLGRPVTRPLAVYRQTEVSLSIPRTKAYWIPAAWSSIADRLKMHGISVDRISEARDVAVDMYRLDN